MKTLRPALLVLAAVAVGLAVGLLVLGRDDGLPPPDGDGEGGAMSQRTSVEPSVHLFGEPLVAEAEFLVDPGRVAPSTVRLDARFDPYSAASAVRTETRAGDLVRVLYRYRLRCTAGGCLPTDTSREIRLETARVTYARRDAGALLGGEDGSVRAQDIVSWPTFQVVSRLGAFDVERARWRAELAALPELTRRSSPTMLGAALLGGAALLALLGVALLGSQLRRPREADAAVEEERRETSLERALAGVVASSSNGAGAEQRRSLERLARELSSAGRSELAASARRLAWSPRPAERPQVDSLAADVRAVLEEDRA